MAWVFFARAPQADVEVWPGRRALACIDAVAWPAAWGVVVHEVPGEGGLVRPAVIALCAVMALMRAHRALAENHRYHFTTWRWGRRLLFVVALAYAGKLAFNG